MEKIKSIFSISDLESLSGISAHTIRIWEKRYCFLSPVRTHSNIRKYSNDDLCKLLNTAFLIKNGMKISKIATLSKAETEQKIKELHNKANNYQHEINELKKSILLFDNDAFNQTYANLKTRLEFSGIYRLVFVPLMQEIGILWQTQSVSSVHEHFLTHLIKQKLYANMEDFKEKKIDTDQSATWVIFTPPNEFHELGSLFMEYILLLNEKKTINLGPSNEITDIITLRKSISDKIYFICWWTILPDAKEISDYVNHFSNEILKQGDMLYLIANDHDKIKPGEYQESIRVYDNPAILVKHLNLPVI